MFFRIFLILINILASAVFGSSEHGLTLMCTLGVPDLCHEYRWNLATNFVERQPVRRIAASVQAQFPRIARKSPPRIASFCTNKLSIEQLCCAISLDRAEDVLNCFEKKAKSVGG